MQLTRNKLKQIIKEELKKVIKEKEQELQMEQFLALIIQFLLITILFTRLDKSSLLAPTIQLRQSK